jgi:hypothetical protein
VGSSPLIWCVSSTQIELIFIFDLVSGSSGFVSNLKEIDVGSNLNFTSELSTQRVKEFECDPTPEYTNGSVNIDIELKDDVPASFAITAVSFSTSELQQRLFRLARNSNRMEARIPLRLASLSTELDGKRQ